MDRRGLIFLICDLAGVWDTARLDLSHTDFKGSETSEWIGRTVKKGQDRTGQERKG